MMVDGIDARGRGVVVEVGCVFSHAGKSFEAGGASVSAESIVGYMGPAEGREGSTRMHVGDRGDVRSWDGSTKLGRYFVKSVHRDDRSFTSDERVYVDITVKVGSETRHYHGQTGGWGMVVTARRRKAELRA